MPVAEPGFHKPLYKMLTLMFKPKMKLMKTPLKKTVSRRPGRLRTKKSKLF